jgi:hypothetical protein
MKKIEERFRLTNRLVCFSVSGNLNLCVSIRGRLGTHGWGGQVSYDGLAS